MINFRHSNLKQTLKNSNDVTNLTEHLLFKCYHFGSKCIKQPLFYKIIQKQINLKVNLSKTSAEIQQIY